jgi:hypothetical protein
MKRPPHIAAHEDQLTATDLEITDSTVVECFQQFDSDAERENAFKRLLKVGVMTMNLAETAQEEEFAERKFTEMQRDLQEEIDRIKKEVNEKFGDDGDVPEIFETHLGEDGPSETADRGCLRRGWGVHRAVGRGTRREWGTD